MSKEEKSVILAVDLGNYNTKVAFNNDQQVFSSRFVKDNLNAEPVESAYSIEFNNNIYLMERGSFEHEFNKTKKDYMPNLMYSIAKTISEEVNNIDLVLGIPISHIQLSDNFKNDLENKTFTFKYKSKIRTVNIKKVAVVAEGISSYFYLNELQRSKPTLVIDIGGRTCNFAAYKNNRMIAKHTYPNGMIHLYDDILKKHNGNKGTDYELHDVQEYIDLGLIEDDLDIKRTFINKVMNELKMVDKIEAYNVWFTGGGSVRLENIIRELDIKNLKFMQDCIFSNVIGNYKLAQAKWNI